MNLRTAFLLIGILSIYVILTGGVILWIISTPQLDIPDKVLVSAIFGAFWGLTFPQIIKLGNK